ncbi:MAG: sugar phosphate isomerase/epimerase family protein [Cyclobacteriaceae bacterium]
MHNRREFISKASAGIAGATALFLPAAASVSEPDKRIGIISNTVKNEMADDYRKTYQTLADIGYRYIESPYEPEGVSRQELSKFIESLGLRSLSVSIGMGNLVKGELDQALQKADDLGVEYIICYYPWMSSADNLTPTEVLETAERINKYGKQIKEAGYRFAWHNHAKEFAEVEGQLAFDMLMENTDPNYVTVELDWYWVVKGGQNPVDCFEKYPGRFEIAHVKDMNNNIDGGISCVGQGIIDFQPIFDKASVGGVKYFNVENERAVKGLPCARVSYEHVSQLINH